LPPPASYSCYDAVFFLILSNIDISFLTSIRGVSSSSFSIGNTICGACGNENYCSLFTEPSTKGGRDGGTKKFIFSSSVAFIFVDLSSLLALPSPAGFEFAIIFDCAFFNICIF
jgi:hypothetical protein